MDAGFIVLGPTWTDTWNISAVKAYPSIRCILFYVYCIDVLIVSAHRKKMTGKNQYNGFQSPMVVQPAVGGNAYIFGNNSETECSEEDGESYELRSRGRERLRRSASRERMDDIVYVMRDIKEGDTLISISLQYFCSVSQQHIAYLSVLFSFSIIGICWWTAYMAHN